MSSASPRTRRPSVGPVLALTVTTLLALLLWGATFWQVGTTAGAATADSHASGEVLACPSGILSAGCTVRYADPAGAAHTQSIDRPGLIGVSPGDVVPITISGDGGVAVGGWRPWVDALILAGLAVVMTSGATRWLGSVLHAGDELTSFDLGEDTGRGARWRRDAG